MNERGILIDARLRFEKIYKENSEQIQAEADNEQLRKMFKGNLVSLGRHANRLDPSKLWNRKIKPVLPESSKNVIYKNLHREGNVIFLPYR